MSLTTRFAMSGTSGCPDRGPGGLVIFGVTGDLPKKADAGDLDCPNRGLLAGLRAHRFALRELSRGIRSGVYDAVKEHPAQPSADRVGRLAEGFRFVQGAFDDDDAFEPARGHRA